ncbi:DapH/DapD/GlmU-related protein [Mucilaginibacter dorajii]|uniref:DapH/DapD/GlmU-related protein n=2 Tax=Mucilaginibacter dorajii TaxID=692994 RepID=A0ABP7PI87_9SPHI
MVGVRKFNYLRIMFLTWLWTCFNRFNAMYMWGIALGENSVFCGKAIFFKAENSQISIGNNCIFVSDANSKNLIGINRPCIINTQKPGAIITIGDNSGFSGTVLGATVKIVIGKDVKCGANTTIIDSDWHPEDSRSGIPKPIFIEDNVWLGANVVVLKGVTIGVNTVIGANSIVTKSMPANVIAAGNPCVVIKSIKNG